MLSFVRALATVDWRRFIGLPEAPSWSRIDATSRRAYQTSMFRISAKRAIVVAVFAHRRPHDRAAGRVGEAAIAAGDGETGGEPFHVPLERPRQRLVEVVELKTSLRSGAAKMPKFERCASPQSWAWIPVRGPSARSAAIRYAAPRKKVNGGLQHAPVPDRAELRKPRLRLILEQVDRISAHRRRLPTGMRRTGQLAASRLSPRGARTRGGVAHRFRLRRRLVLRRALVEDFELIDVRIHFADCLSLRRSGRQHFVLTG